MLPLSATPNFVMLAETYRDFDIACPNLKGVTLAQWALESGWGTSGIARRYQNYAGMHWGSIDSAFGESVTVGGLRYTSFTSPTMFIEGYWHRLAASAAWAGWEDHVKDPENFITFITPEWLNGRKADGSLLSDEKKYIKDILDIRSRRTEEFFVTGEDNA
jgi:Mannosyl-glycoprotein endo-beta-N-acetylglucosaminidase